MNGETVIDMSLQCGRPSRPIPDVRLPACSAAAIRLRNLYVDGETSVSVAIFNADGVLLTIAAERDGADWIATFPASHFSAYGAVSNGIRISLVRDSDTFIAAHGNLVIEDVDGSAVPADPSAHLVTRDELAALFDQIAVADSATQKEVRTALQEIIAKMKGLAPIVAAALLALPVAGEIPAGTLWEDVPPQSPVAGIVAQFAPAADLSLATNYTDRATNALAASSAAALTTATNTLATSSAAAFMPQSNAYTKAETDARIITTNAVASIVANLGDHLPSSAHVNFGDKMFYSEYIEADSFNAVAGWADYHDGNGDNLEAALGRKADADSVPTKAELAAVSNEAQVVYRLFSGSNVVDEVTNYNSQVRLPSRRLYQLTESNTYHMVWNELDQHTNTLAQAKKYTDESGTNYAPRAWSRTTAMYGAEAPSNTTWISTPTTVIAAGYEYQKYATSGGAIWVLTSRGATYDFSPNTNNTAYLNIAAQDGTPIFRIEKTDSYLLGVNPSAIEVENDTMYVDVNLVASSHPFVRIKETLADSEWAKEEDDIPAALATVSWTATANGYRCAIENNTGGGSLFAYFEYLQEGSVKIVNGGLLDISGGIIVNGTIYTRIGTATISGHTVLTLEQ